MTSDQIPGQAGDDEKATWERQKGQAGDDEGVLGKGKMARGSKITEESQLKNMGKKFSSVEWKQHSINNLKEITQLYSTRVIIDKHITIKHFHSTHQGLRVSS